MLLYMRSLTCNSYFCLVPQRELMEVQLYIHESHRWMNISIHTAHQNSKSLIYVLRFIHACHNKLRRGVLYYFCKLSDKKKKKMHRLTVKERPIFLTLLLHLFSPSVWLWMLFFSLGFFKNPPPQKLSVLWLVILPQSVVIGLSLSVCNVMKCNSPYHNRPAPEGIL